MRGAYGPGGPSHPALRPGERDFLEVELPLDAPARFVGDAAFAEHPVEVLPLGVDELQAEAVIERRELDAVAHGLRKLPADVVVIGREERRRLFGQIALGGDLLAVASAPRRAFRNAPSARTPARASAPPSRRARARASG